MPRLEGRPAPCCSQCENQECTCKASTTEVTTATTEVTTAKAVVRLTVELPLTYANELAKLLERHVNFSDFPWAATIYEALRPEVSCPEVVFSDADYGANVFLRRKKD